jgi:hypothetical protein
MLSQESRVPSWIKISIVGLLVLEDWFDSWQSYIILAHVFNLIFYVFLGIVTLIL